MSDALTRAAEAAREFEVQAGITLRLRLPTRLAMRRLVAEAGDSFASAQEPILLEAVIGWSGVPAGQIIPGREGDLQFSPRLIAHVLDRYPEAADEAFLRVIERFRERSAAAESAAGN